MPRCPRCKAELSEAEARTIRASLHSGMRKTRTGGHHGGRPKNPDCEGHETDCVIRMGYGICNCDGDK